MVLLSQEALFFRPLRHCLDIWQATPAGFTTTFHSCTFRHLKRGTPHQNLFLPLQRWEVSTVSSMLRQLSYSKCQRQLHLNGFVSCKSCVVVYWIGTRKSLPLTCYNSVPSLRTTLTIIGMVRQLKQAATHPNMISTIISISWRPLKHYFS